MRINKKLIYLIQNPLRIFIWLLLKLPYFRFINERRHYNTYVPFKFWFKQKVLNLGGNRNVYWPVHPTSSVFDTEHIEIGVDSAPGIMGGAYITGIGGLKIGNYCYFAKNITIVTANHDLLDTRKRVLKPVCIGDYS